MIRYKLQKRGIEYPFDRKEDNNQKRNLSYRYTSSDINNRPAIDPPNDNFQSLRLCFNKIHRNINLPKKISKKRGMEFMSIYRSLRASKYSSYAHCKYCFSDQQQHDSKHKNPNCLCCKCGMPLPLFVTFTRDESFCVICSMMNKYDHNNHGRCLLHLSAPNKNVGATYYIYKTNFSVSSASKKKKKTQKSDRLKEITEPEIWKLNSALRFEYLYLCRHLIGKELSWPIIDEEGITALRKTVAELNSRYKEIGENMNIHYMYLKLNFKDFSEKNKEEFFKNLKELIQRTINVLTYYLNFILDCQRISYIQLQQQLSRQRVQPNRTITLSKIRAPNSQSSQQFERNFFQNGYLSGGYPSENRLRPIIMENLRKSENENTLIGKKRKEKPSEGESIVLPSLKRIKICGNNNINFGIE